MKFKEVKDSGKRYENENGGLRDTDEGKIDYTLIPTEGLKRLANHYKNGLKKYGRDNWKKLSTEEDMERFKQSALRHIYQWIDGETDEDHAFAVVFNIIAYEYNKEKENEQTKEKCQTICF